MSDNSENKTILRNGTIVNHFQTILSRKLHHFNTFYKNTKISRRKKVRKCCDVLQYLIDQKAVWVRNQKYFKFRNIVKAKMLSFLTENEPELNVMVNRVLDLLKIDNDKYSKM